LAGGEGADARACLNAGGAPGGRVARPCDRQADGDRLGSRDEMKLPPSDKAHAEQMRQRVRVGMIGLAAVVLMIGLASAIFSTVNREQPVAAAGAAKPEVVVNMAAPGPAPSASASNEPLAELGVTPSAPNTPAAAPAAPAAADPTP
jgi:hypothetical protein